MLHILGRIVNIQGLVFFHQFQYILNGFRIGGDVVFQCRDEGPLRAKVRWTRDGGLKPGSTDVRGRLEMFKVTVSNLV